MVIFPNHNIPGEKMKYEYNMRKVMQRSSRPSIFNGKIITEHITLYSP